MQMPDMPINVEVDPNEDTEWNDILRSKGIIPEKPPSPTPMIEEALNEARRLAHENRLEGKELDELAELEDEEEYDTVGGLIYHRIGGIPSPGDRVEVDGLTLTVESTDGRRVGKVLVVRTPDGADAEADEDGDR